MGSEGRGDGGSEEKSSMGWGGNGLRSGDGIAFLNFVKQ